MKDPVKYISGWFDHGALLRKAPRPISFEAWTDADWARDNSARHSPSGYALFANKGPIIWSSHLQTATALSTTDAEFTALSVCIREVLWKCNLLSEIGLVQFLPTVVQRENLWAIACTKHMQGIQKVRHIGIKYHAAREAVDVGDFVAKYTPSMENRSDGLTKALIGETI